MKRRLVIAIIASLFCIFAKAGIIPFGFWKTQTATPTISFPAHSCASISGTQTFASNTNIDDTAITTHQCKHWVVNTGVTLTFVTNTQAPIGDLTLNGTAQITPSACTTTNCYSVNIYSKGNITMATSSKIIADGKGYLGGYVGGNGAAGRTYGNTATGGATAGTYSAGGSYGGIGGDTLNSELPNNPYGSITQPMDPGSGGAQSSASFVGGSGGGVIRLLAQGTLQIDGFITANGGTPTTGGGGGSGGSIWITASTIATVSAAARITANGSASNGSSNGSGSGGRISLEYNSLSTLAINTTYVRAYGNSSSTRPSSSGTIFARDGTSTYGDLYIYGTTIATTKNIQLGYWGAVASRNSTSITMTGNMSFIPVNGLATKTVIPNILASTLSSHTISSNTASVITVSSGDPTTTTSNNMVWVVPDLDNRFDNVTIDGQYVDAPYLKVENALVVKSSAFLYSVYVTAKSISIQGATTTMTTFSPTTTNIFKLDVTATDLEVQSSAKITVAAKGYLGGYSGTNASGTGMTYGNSTTGGAAAVTYAGGGSYGGIGGSGLNGELPNNPYGSITQPIDPGSGGASTSVSYSGGNGGGVIRLTVTGTLTVDGDINADGGNGNTLTAGGSGGSIWVTAGDITTGLAAPRFNAKGGTGASTSYGSGGGGRIAIEYTTLSSFVINSTHIRAYGVSANRSSSSGTVFAKGPSNTLGDLYIFAASGASSSAAKNIQLGYYGYVSARTSSSITMTGASNLLSANLFSGKSVIPNILATTLNSHTIASNTTSVITTSSGDPTTTTSNGMMWAVPSLDNEFDNVTINSQNVDAPYLKVTGTLSLTNAAILTTVLLDAGTTSATGTGSTINTFDPTITNVFKVSITGTDVTLGALTKINVTAKGYLGGYSGTNSGSAIGRTYGNTTTGGPAVSTFAAGASNGGMGGSSSSSDAPSAPYGDITAPMDPGTGGSSTNPSFVGPNGGGVVRINISGTLSLNGTIVADGGAAPSSTAGAAGGSVWITANTVTSTAGIKITANGAAGSSSSYGAGGGGRIAVEYSNLSTFAISTASMTAYGPSAGSATQNAHAGSIYGIQSPNLGALIFSNNSVTGWTGSETRITQALNLSSLTVAGNASVKQISSGNAIATQNAVTVTSPAVMKVPNNGTINNTGPWTWFTYGSVTGTITEY